MLGGFAIALLLSTEYLAQPFVWDHWSPSEVLLGWVELLRDDAVVGACMAAGGWMLLRRQRQAAHRDLALGLALVAGAACGELALMGLGLPDAAFDGLAWAGRVMRWAIVVAAPIGLHRAWRGLSAQQAAVETVRRQRLDGEVQMAQLQLFALQAQIEPHFLFNTLATVEELAGSDRERGRRLLDHLLTFVAMSQAIGSAPRTWSVAQELALVRAYLGVFELRMDGRLAVSVAADDAALGCEIPPLMLGTLVENAVKHGIRPLQEGGLIAVRVCLEDGLVMAEVRDSGAGFAASSGHGIGLANTRARLRTLYGERAALTLESNQPRGVVARLRLPRSDLAS